MILIRMYMGVGCIGRGKKGWRVSRQVYARGVGLPRLIQ